MRVTQVGHCVTVIVQTAEPIGDVTPENEENVKLPMLTVTRIIKMI